MQNLKKSIRFGLMISLSINLLGFSVNIFLNGFENAIKDILYLFPISFSIFFFPGFSAHYYYKLNSFKSIKHTLTNLYKPLVFSAISVYLIVTFFLVVKKGFRVRFLYVTALYNSITASFVSLMIYFVFHITNQNQKKVFKNRFKISTFKIAIIWLFVSIIYAVLHELFGHGLFNKNLLALSIIGLIAVTTTVFANKYNLKINKPIPVFVSLYLFNCFFLLVLYILVVTFLFDYKLDFNVKSFFQGIIIFSPYLLFLTLVTHVFFIVTFQKQEKQHLKQLTVASSLKYENLKSQISPHFLFNNISVLTGLIEENPKKAVDFSNDLAEIYRYFLNQENKDIVLLDAELNFAERYLNLLKIRYENALEMIIENTTSSENYIIPMALQQLLENIVKHNEISQENRVKVLITVTNDSLIINNNINPKLFVNRKTSSGLENIKKRYAFFTNQTVLVEKSQTHFIVTLPLLNLEA